MASHWYQQDGKPLYEVPKADGKGLRDTNLRDARKLHLQPSVTTIIAEAASPGLTNYFQDQILEAILSTKMPVPDGSDFEEIEIWKQEIRKDAKQHAAIAADKGNKIHDALELFMTTSACKATEYEFVVPVREFLDEKVGLGFVNEKSFSHPLGFGGKVDLHKIDNLGKKKPQTAVIIDFKTKPDKAFSKLEQYDNHYIQLAAYRIGLGLPDAECYNLFISNETPGKFKLLPEVWNEEEELKIQRGEEMFFALLHYWKLKTGYDSSYKLKEVKV